MRAQSLGYVAEAKFAAALGSMQPTLGLIERTRVKKLAFHRTAGSGH